MHAPHAHTVCVPSASRHPILITHPTSWARSAMMRPHYLACAGLVFSGIPPSMVLLEHWVQAAFNMVSRSPTAHLSATRLREYACGVQGKGGWGRINALCRVCWLSRSKDGLENKAVTVTSTVWPYYLTVEIQRATRLAVLNNAFCSFAHKLIHACGAVYVQRVAGRPGVV